MEKIVTLHATRERLESVIADAIDLPDSIDPARIRVRVVWKYDDAGWLDGADIVCYEDQANNPYGSM
jgi:hypothetical protein